MADRFKQPTHKIDIVNEDMIFNIRKNRHLSWLLKFQYTQTTVKAAKSNLIGRLMRNYFSTK